MRRLGLVGLVTRAAALGAVALGMLAGATASADSIGPDCATCQGSIYTLEYDPTPVATTGTSQTFRITFTINSAGYNGGGIGIDTIAVKVASGPSGLINGTLIAAPSGPANWNNFVDMGLNAAGCSSGGSGFDCSRVKMGGTVPGVGGTLVWTWNIEVDSGTLFTDPLEASVKARYVDDARAKVGALVSESITMQPSATNVPEPGTLALFGLGLVSLATHARRVRRR